MKTLETLKTEKEKQYISYYKYNCDFCHKDIVFNLNEEGVERELFEPKEQEQIAWEIMPTGEKNKFKEITYKETFSSNPDKDIIKFICPNCGHRHSIKWKDIKNNFCNYWGNNNIKFELTEKETKTACNFIKKHSKCVKDIYSSTGGQFSYTIQPTGLGNIVTIKCNACGKTKDVTEDFS